MVCKHGVDGSKAVCPVCEFDFDEYWEDVQVSIYFELIAREEQEDSTIVEVYRPRKQVDKNIAYDYFPMQQPLINTAGSLYCMGGKWKEDNTFHVTYVRGT